MPDRVEGRLNYADLIRDARWRKDWISFDGIVDHAGNDCVYCGITSFGADIFKAYDRTAGKFVDLGFKKVGNRYDAKFHRAMELTSDGKMRYAATALLHDVDRYWEAPGGGLCKLDTRTGRTTQRGTPIPHNYIQSIALDETRGLIYSTHFTPERLSVFDLTTKKARDLGPIGSGFGMARVRISSSTTPAALGAAGKRRGPGNPPLAPTATASASTSRTGGRLSISTRASPTATGSPAR